MESLIPVVTPEQEEEALRVLKNFRGPIRNNRDMRGEKQVPCEHKDGMNFITVNTFLPSDMEGWLNEVTQCFKLFDENSDPITVILPMNGGGVVAFEQGLEHFLNPNMDYRWLTAVRKSDTAKKIFIDKNGGAGLSNDTCVENKEGDKETLTKFYDTTEVDTFGNDIKHTRTAKHFLAYKSVLSPYTSYALKKNPRKPTDIIVATDGYCFSACSIFVNNLIRKGGAIVTGFGSTYPDDDLFVAGQCPSSVLSQELYLDADILNVNLKHGISFGSTYYESYNITNDKSYKIPGDFDILRIDKHLGYYKFINPNVEEMLPLLKALHKDYQEHCNPLNHRLLLVDDKCEVDDPNALTAGYECGGDGKWVKDVKKCKISTCKPGYVVDFETNKCVEFTCDLRSKDTPSGSGSGHPSTAFSVYPVMAFVMFIISVFSFLTL